MIKGLESLSYEEKLREVDHGHDHGQPALGVSTWAGGVDQITSTAALTLCDSVISFLM